MLQLYIEGGELFDEVTSSFLPVKPQEITLEHSLLSISKWESKWKKGFLSSRSGDNMTREETLDYVRCMTITQNVDPNLYLCIRNDHLKKIQDYIDDPMTATTFNNQNAPKGKRSTVVTSEVVYYWMIALNIPFECQKWHLNRLLALIRVCNIKNSPKKKRSRKEFLESRAALNAQRRRERGSFG